MPATERGTTHALDGRPTDATLPKTWSTAVTGCWLAGFPGRRPRGDGRDVAVRAGDVRAGRPAGAGNGVVSPDAIPVSSVSGPFPARTVLGITGLAASFAVAEAAGVGETLILDGVWFAGPAVGFLVTADYTNDWSRRLYAATAVATLGGAVLVVTVQPFESVHYLAAAVVRGCRCCTTTCDSTDPQ